MKAVKVESFKWLYCERAGIVFVREDGTAHGGMMVIDPSDLHGSFHTEWKRYSETNATVKYKTDENGNLILDDKKNRIFDSISFGPFSDITKEQAWEAVHAWAAEYLS